MRIEKEDLEILNELHNLGKNETITVYSLSEKIFPNTERSYDKYKNCNLLISRFKKLENYGLVEISKENGKNFYSLLIDRCHIIELKLKKANVNGKFMLLQISEEDNKLSTKEKKVYYDTFACFELN